MKSSVIIGQLLNSEGFSDHTAACVEKWYKRNYVLTDRQQQQIARIEKEMSQWCAGLSASQRLLLGKFVAFHKKMGFTAGLHIGLTCMAVNNCKEVDRNGKFTLTSRDKPDMERVKRSKSQLKNGEYTTLDSILEAGQ